MVNLHKCLNHIFMNWIYEPWTWYFSGLMIAFVMFLLLMMGKKFGMSSNLRTLCTMCGADKKTDFFQFDWREQRWNLAVVLGTIIGGFIASKFLTNTTAVQISQETIVHLKALGFQDAGTAYLPTKMFDTTVFYDFKTIVLLAIGGLLIGFGSRYAGGCTSGHAISGLSNFQLPSLVAVVGFFIGGLVMVHFLFPLIF